MPRRYFKHTYSFVKGHKSLKGYYLFMPGIVAIILGTHFTEILIWALFYLVRGVLPDSASAIVFSINAYTTLGASNITLPDKWRGIGGFEAMAGMLMFSWSTALLASVIVKLHSLDT